MNNEEEHVISDREKRAYQEAKKVQPSHERRTLSTNERILFLELVSKVASPAVFQRKLGIDASDVEHYKQQLDIQSHDEARVMLRRMHNESEQKREAEILRNTRDARAAEAIANQRLEEFERQQNQQTNVDRPKQADIAADDAVRQRRFEEQQEENVPVSYWRLRLPQGDAQQAEVIERFRKDIQYRGINFCREKYGTDAQSIRAEASRLNLRINWDTVRR